MWITLALQKQKGFREQQQNREERRSQREAKLAEKQARDSVCPTLTFIYYSTLFYSEMPSFRSVSYFAANIKSHRQQRKWEHKSEFKTSDPRRAQETGQSPGTI